MADRLVNEAFMTTRKIILSIVPIAMILLLVIFSCYGDNINGKMLQALHYGMSPEAVNLTVNSPGDIYGLIKIKDSSYRFVEYSGNRPFKSLYLLYVNESLSASLFENNHGDEVKELVFGNKIIFSEISDDWQSYGISLREIPYIIFIPIILFANIDNVSVDKVSSLKLDMTEQEVEKKIDKPDQVMSDNGVTLWVYKGGTFIGTVYYVIGFKNSRLDSVLRIGSGTELTIAKYNEFKNWYMDNIIESLNN